MVWYESPGLSAPGTSGRAPISGRQPDAAAITAVAVICSTIVNLRRTSGRLFGFANPGRDAITIVARIGSIPRASTAERRAHQESYRCTAGRACHCPDAATLGRAVHNDGARTAIAQAAASPPDPAPAAAVTRRRLAYPPAPSDQPPNNPYASSASTMALITAYNRSLRIANATSVSATRAIGVAISSTTPACTIASALPAATPCATAASDRSGDTCPRNV